jgi:DNA cross-link repair 1B protein
MVGCVFANTSISVDSFKPNLARNTSARPLYFLTHGHTDHLDGLHPSWSHGLLFCTPITMALLKKRFEFEDTTMLVCQFFL